VSERDSDPYSTDLGKAILEGALDQMLSFRSQIVQGFAKGQISLKLFLDAISIIVRISVSTPSSPASTARKLRVWDGPAAVG
jgi:hypothetical protein